MGKWGVAFGNPYWPWIMGLLAILLVAMWYWSYRSLSGLGNYRRIVALVVRSLVLALLMFSLADLQLLRTNDRLTVIYLLDQSASVPVLQRQAMLNYVRDEVDKHRDRASGDRASVIVFGRDANIEIPPIDQNLPLFGRLESAANLRSDATNLEAAMKLAQATFPEDSSRRLVVISDGNENLGRAESIAAQLAADGVSIDVVPVTLQRRAEVAVERVALPADVRKEQPFHATVVLNNLTPVMENDPGIVKGRVKLTRVQGGNRETIAETPVTLDPGKTVFRFEDLLVSEPDFYEYRADFIADDALDDMLVQNNQAAGFTYVRGKGHVLLIEDWENRDADGNGEFAYLVDRLRAHNIQVTVQFTNELFTSLAELQRYDAVILANVPRSSGESAESLSTFSDRQIEMLVHNTQQMGCGLIMLGGQNAFGAGGWANTDLEKAMPVDFKIKNTKIQAVGALVMIMHASEMADGNRWQKIIGREALKALGPQDYAGVVHWDSTGWKEAWLWGKPQGIIPVGGSRAQMIARLDRMTPGDMPDFDPAMRIAAAGFASLPQAAVKHMIIISDGDPSPASGNVIARLKQLKVKVSTVAVGTHGPAGSSPLRKLASQTGGKYYVVRDPRALPRIYQREARRVARPLIVEKDIQPMKGQWHEIMEGIENAPPLRGFVMTHVKENPLVEVGLLSSYPVNTENATLLASWTYGLGRTVAFTSDAGHRWTADWTSWSEYDKFWTQLVRFAMRPTGDTGSFTVSTQRKDGKVQVVVDALNKDDEFLNFLDVAGAVVGPNMDPESMQLRQTAPGRYVGEFDASRSGSYFLTLNTGPNSPPIRTGVNVPYSPEYRDQQTNQAVLDSLASLQPKGGTPGKVIPVPLNQPDVELVSEVSTFRRDFAKNVSSNYVWPWLVLACGLAFFGDVFIRRVAVEFGWLFHASGKVRDFVLRRTPDAAPDDRMERLRSRKAAVNQQIDQQRAAVRFEPEPDAPVDIDALDPGRSTRPGSAKEKAEATMTPPESDEEDFAARLMKAKKKALKNRETRE